MQNLLKFTFAITFLLAHSFTTAGQGIFFPNQSILKDPEPCEDQETICSDDLSKYPHEKISAIISKSIELQIAPEATDRFFGNNQDNSDGLESNTDVESNLVGTCEQKNAIVSRYVRAKNVLGKWVYIAQESETRRQYIKIIQCQSPDQACKNDADSPHGEGTTICRQLYRTQKFLAIDANGEMLVDTFSIPSGCSCNFLGRFGVNLRANFDSQRGRQPPRCHVDNATQNLEAPNIPATDHPPAKRLHLEGSSPDISPCAADEFLCEVEDQTYPKNSIEKMLRTHIAFKSPRFFGTVFGDVCNLKESDISVRGGFNSIQESDLCDSFQKYVYPKKAKSVDGVWHYIINTDEYRQGITIETCLSLVKGASCMYGGTEGMDPSSTVCKQLYSSHFLLALTSNGTVSLEEFSVPSSCGCFTYSDSEEQIVFSIKKKRKK